MKLLTRTIRNYLTYSALLIAISTPLFYLAIEKLFVHKMDEELLEHKTEFIQAIPYLNSEDDLTYHHRHNKEFMVKRTQELPLHDSLYTYEAYDSLEHEVIPFRTLRTGVVIMGKPYLLFIRESLVSSTALITAIMGIQASLLTLLLLGLVVINRKLSKVVWDPFYTILDKLKKYHIEQDGSIDLPRSSTAEFRDLSEAIKQLVEKNHKAYQSQKEFTENASHELQTPLAICRSKLELLLQTKDLTQEQAEIISSLYAATDRISRLNKNLLLLSKIENRQFLDQERIELYSVVLKCIDTYNQQAQKKKINVACALNSEASVTANPILIEVLINNLVSNAIRHTHVAGEVKIEITRNKLLISNTGTPFDNPDKIFERFHRESRSPHGSGLGLAIVKEISEAQGFTVQYAYASGMHHFSIQFPDAK